MPGKASRLMYKVITFAEFKDEQALLDAAKALKEKRLELLDAYTPFPIHGLDEVLGEKRSRLPIVCFIAGSIGCISSMYFQIWTSAQSWPINVGGKPFASIPAFIPVTFEVTVLLAGLTSVAAFFLRSRLYPGKAAQIPHPNVTSDGFWLAIEHQAAKMDLNALEVVLREQGGKSIRTEEKNA